MWSYRIRVWHLCPTVSSGSLLIHADPLATLTRAFYGLLQDSHSWAFLHFLPQIIQVYLGFNPTGYFYSSSLKAISFSNLYLLHGECTFIYHGWDFDIFIHIERTNRRPVYSKTSGSCWILSNIQIRWWNGANYNCLGWDRLERMSELSLLNQYVIRSTRIKFVAIVGRLSTFWMSRISNF